MSCGGESAGAEETFARLTVIASPVPWSRRESETAPEICALPGTYSGGRMPSGSTARCSAGGMVN
eukprot:scaffold36531_cov128-Isochrysis_galbana.AAC.3